MNTASNLWMLVAAELALFGLFWLATTRLRVGQVRTGILTVAAFNLIMATGLVLLALRPIWPNVLTVPGVDILVLLAVALLSHGGALQMHDTVRKDPFVILVLGSVLILAFYWVWPITNARIAVTFLGSSWIFMRMGWYASKLLGRGDHDSRMVNFLRVAAALTAALLILRTAEGLLKQDSMDLSHDNLRSHMTAFGVMIGLTLANGMLAYALARGLLQELERLATQDPLTGLSNRRAFWLVAERHWAAWSRDTKPFAIACFDIDHFKAVNDTYGHSAGDEAIKLMGQALRTGSRGTDEIARMGGEEFVVLIGDIADSTLAIEIADRVREIFSSLPLPEALNGASLTVSAGVACVEQADVDMNKVMQRADEALYAAKHTGRNRVCLAPLSSVAIAKDDRALPVS